MHQNAPITWKCKLFATHYAQEKHYTRGVVCASKCGKMRLRRDLLVVCGGDTLPHTPSHSTPSAPRSTSLNLRRQILFSRITDSDRTQLDRVYHATQPRHLRTVVGCDVTVGQCGDVIVAADAGDDVSRSRSRSLWRRFLYQLLTCVTLSAVFWAMWRRSSAVG